MRYFTCKGRGVGLTFLAPDADGTSSGSSNADGSSSNGGTIDFEKLFSDIPFDELDSKTQQAIKKAQETVKTTFATLQKQSIDSPENKEKLEKFNQNLRQLQSDKDIALAQLKKLTGGDPAHQPTEDEYLTAAQETLRKSGFSEEDIKKQAPLYADMLKNQLKVFQKELGKDFGPFAASVIFQESRSAFEEAIEQDSTGVLDIPEVAESVWQQIQARAKAGQPSNAALVLNLAKIAWHDYTAEKKQKGEDVPVLRSAPKSNQNVTTAFTFPGANRAAGATHSIVRQSENPNAPKHEVNPETEAAIEATFKNLYQTTGVAPAALKPKFEKKNKS